MCELFGLSYNGKDRVLVVSGGEVVVMSDLVNRFRQLIYVINNLDCSRKGVLQKLNSGDV